MDTLFSTARWVWTADPGHPNFAIRRFRGTFTLDKPQTLALYVSADSRYTLFLDGVPLGRGPARSDVRHYVYETYDVTLAAGTHLLAAIVLAYQGTVSPIAEMHDQGAFLLEARASDGTVVCATGSDRWRVQTDIAYRPATVTMADGYYGIGASEVVDGTQVPQGWEQPGFDDGGWETPIAILDAYLRERPGDYADPGGRWRLMPRDIPLLYEAPRQFTGWPGETVIPARSRKEWILNAGEYAVGYPLLQTLGGVGAKVEIFYAEALTKDGQKGVRDDTDGTDVIGFADTYLPGGGLETYSPLHWRAFRFVKLVVETADAPLTIPGFSYRMTGYPWERQAAFTVENGPAELPEVLDTDFRTLERCTVETFMDCPYYEQLQYIGDSRLQALLSYVTTGDTRLGARAVRQFDWSRNPDGLTQSRYPTRIEQIIPPFSLIWVLMVEDLWRYAPDEQETVAACLPGCRGVLEWFGRHLTSGGILGGKLPWWNFVDWVPIWETPSGGTPAPVGQGVPSATINLQYLAALQSYVRLCRGLGDEREAEFRQAQAAALTEAIRAVFWDPEALLMREGPTAEWGSTQHGQAWGILTGVIPADAWDSVADSLHNNAALTKASYYHLFYIVEALASAGRLERLWDHWLAPWREALTLHFSTWPETPEPTRSDCHAWSAWPTYIFLTHVLGVNPTSAGFAAWEVTPQRVAGWDTVSGAVTSPQGLIRVSVEWPSSGGPVIRQESPSEATS